MKIGNINDMSNLMRHHRFGIQHMEQTVNSNFKYLQFKRTEENSIRYLTPEEIIDGKAGYVYLPYKIIVTHAEITDASGTRRIRQVSRWTLFVLFLESIQFKIKKIIKWKEKL